MTINKFKNNLLASVITTFPQTVSPLIFPGMIIPFNSGYYNNITGTNVPEGWALCDGNNNTPDLRGRFVLAAGNGDGLTNRTEHDISGEETHTLTIPEMPQHSHTGTTASNGDHNHSGSTGTVNNFGPGNETVNNVLGGATVLGNENGSHSHTISTDGAHTHTFTTNTTGNGDAHNNMPPFYVLTYIMKL